MSEWFRRLFRRRKNQETTYLGSWAVATCLDCRFRFEGAFEECARRLNAHRDKTGHRG